MQLLAISKKAKTVKQSNVKELFVRITSFDWNVPAIEKHEFSASVYNKTERLLTRSSYSKNINLYNKKKKCNFTLLKKLTNKMKNKSKSSKTSVKVSKTNLDLLKSKVSSDKQVLTDKIIKKDICIKKISKVQECKNNVHNNSVKLKELTVKLTPLSPNRIKFQEAKRAIVILEKLERPRPFSHKINVTESEKLQETKQDAKSSSIMDNNDVENNSNVKCNEILRRNRQSTPLINRLRHKNKINYLELSENTTINETPKVQHKENIFSKPKMPIYKQILIDKNKEKDDPYEFDISESEKNQKVKKGKKNRKKLIKKSKSGKNKVPNKTVHKTYESNIQKVLKRIIKNNNILVSNKKNTTQKVLGNINVESTNIVNKENVPVQNTDQCINDKININDNKKNPVEAAKNINTSSKDLLFSNHHIDVPSTEIVQNTCPSPDLFQPDSSSDLFQNDCPSPDTVQNEVNEYFGFDEDVQRGPIVKVLGNVIINQKSVRSEGYKSLLSSKENMNLNEGPWRSPALQNQHYLLTYKKNSLPSLDQESVLDCQLVEKIESRCLRNKTATTSKAENSKTTVQTSLLDYVETSKDVEIDQETVNENCVSLFNYEEFIIRPSKRNMTVRKVFGLLQENTQIESTPIKKKNKNGSDSTLNISPVASTMSSDNPDIEQINNITEIDKDGTASTKNSYFGFESDDIDKTPVVSNDNRPFRVHTEDIKKYKKAVRKELNVEPLSDELPSVLQQNTSGSDTTNMDVHLFDDVEPELLTSDNEETFTYGKKRKPRKRQLSFTDDNGKEKSKKRKKDEMTREEKKQFEKWASDFNAMCEEIDKHELLID